MMYNYQVVSLLHPKRILATSRILYLCGKDMALKKDLHHWDNSRFKTWVIILYVMLKSKIYLVFSDKKAIATFSVKKKGSVLHFGKLATIPEYAGKGVGSWCMEQIEKIAKDNNCSSVSMEVYDKSEQAKEFYLHRGYVVCGQVKTRKHTEYKMEKYLINNKLSKEL